jgi:hypothetical protein
VAKLMDRRFEHLVMFPSVAVDQAGKAISQQILGLLPAPAGQEPERLGIISRGDPQPHPVLAASAKAGFVHMHHRGKLHLGVNGLRRFRHGHTDRIAAGLHGPQRQADAKEVPGKRPGLAPGQPVASTEQADPRLELGVMNHAK